MDDWNALKLVLAIDRSGGLTAAARILGIDHSTAFRRLKALEAQLGVRLFERLPAGSYRATKAGERMALGAERIEDEALALNRDITGGDHRLTGRLRVTSSETLAHSRLTHHLAGFRQSHPGITVELLVDNRVLSLSRREADVALRPLRPPEGDLFGRKLADVAWALYASRTGAFLRPLSAISDLAGHPLIGWEEGATAISAADWLRRVAGPDQVVYRTSSLVNQCMAAEAGVGVALLPCYLGDQAGGLKRVYGPVDEVQGELWIVTHADLRRTARVRAFLESVGGALARERAIFEGGHVSG